jgi:hypothetical protein
MLRENGAPVAQPEHHMKKKIVSDTKIDDLHLLALLIAKRLHEEHAIDEAPARGDYRLCDSKVFAQAGKEVQVDVDLGRGLKVTIFDVWWDDNPELSSLLRNAEDISERIADTLRDADATRAMVADVTAAARREIAKARRRGMPYTLTSVTLPRLQAGSHDLAVARVEHQALGRSLRLEPFAFHAESAEDVVRAFAGIADEQRRWMDRRAGLDRIGATGTIDSVVVAALVEAGLDMPQVLATLRDAEDWIVDLDVADGKRLILHWKEGAVRAQVMLAEGVNWHEGRLSFSNPPHTLKKLPEGTAVNRLFEHPFLEERIRIRGTYRTEGAYLSVTCNEAMLNFDADSGRLWAA